MATWLLSYYLVLKAIGIVSLNKENTGEKKYKNNKEKNQKKKVRKKIILLFFS